MANEFIVKKGLIAPTIEVDELNTKGIATETATRTIYLATTGNDETGDGSSGSPFFSLHRAFKDIKPLVAAPINIYLSSGTYDWSSLGTCYANFQTVLGGQITIKNNNAAIADNYTVIAGEGGTFTSNDANEYVHTNSGKAYTTNEFLGKFVHPTSMISGTLPTGAQSYYPVIANDATTITTSAPSDFVSGYNWANYDVVGLNTILNFGTNNIIFSGANQINTTFEYLEMTFGKIAAINSSEFATPQKIFFNNCYVNGDVISTCSANRAAFNVTNNPLNAFFLTGCGIFGTRAGTMINCNAGDDSISSLYHSCINQQDGTASRTPVVVKNMNLEVFYLHVINAKAMIELKLNAGKVSLSGKVSSAGGTKFCVQTGDRAFKVVDNYADLFGGFYALSFANEPATGRLTFDGTAAATVYGDLVKGILATDIAPTANQVTYSEFDVEITDETKGIILKTPDTLNRYRITIDNSGNIVTTVL